MTRAGLHSALSLSLSSSLLITDSTSVDRLCGSQCLRQKRKMAVQNLKIAFAIRAIGLEDWSNFVDAREPNDVPDCAFTFTFMFEMMLHGIVEIR